MNGFLLSINSFAFILFFQPLSAKFLYHNDLGLLYFP